MLSMYAAYKSLTKKKKNKKKKPKSTPMRVAAPKLSGNKIARSVAVRKATAAPSGRLSMSKCALKYALAVSDPLSAQARGACVPVGAAPTMKTHAYIRFDITLGTNGVGAALFAPCLANNLPSVYYTTGAYTGTQSTYLQPYASEGSSVTTATLATGWTTATHNGPFNASQFIDVTSSDPAVQGRVVAAGARAQYTGTTLNESGLYYCYHDPAHNNLSGSNVAHIGSFGDANVEGVSRTPCTLSMFAVDDSETTFSAAPELSPTTNPASCLVNLYPLSGGSNIFLDDYVEGPPNFKTPFIPVGAATRYQVAGAPTGVILITGVAGSTVHVEYVIHLEYIGVPAGTMLTSITPDIEGTNVVRAAALAMPQKKLANPKKDGWSLMYSGMSEAFNAAKPILVPVLKEALMSLVLAA